MLASGKIEVTEGAPAVVKTLAEFDRLGVGELRRLLLSFGLSDEGALEKRELRALLLESGRIVIEGEGEAGRGCGYSTAGYNTEHHDAARKFSDGEPGESTRMDWEGKADEACGTTASPRSPTVSHGPDSSSSGSSGGRGENSGGGAAAASGGTPRYPRSALKDMKVSELKALATRHAVSVEGCLYKVR